MSTAAAKLLSRNTASLRSTHPDHPRLLLVDDDELVLSTLTLVLARNGFAVVPACGVNQALRLITQQPFDVLLSDLHMPGAGDGLTVVSAMRHANPAAVTFIFSGCPEMLQATDAIRQQVDEVVSKPVSPVVLVDAIRDRLSHVKPCIVPMS
jgi:DNA-binding NtrC family response regulator